MAEWNKDVLSKIMTKYLSLQDLRSLRLTNKFWKDIVSSELEKREKEEYKEFVEAVFNENRLGIEKGLKNGFVLSRPLFLEMIQNNIKDKIMKAENNIHFYKFPQFVVDTAAILDLQHINDGEKTLLDELIELYRDYLENSFGIRVPLHVLIKLKDSVFQLIKYYALDLQRKGGAITKQPVYIDERKFIDKVY